MRDTRVRSAAELVATLFALAAAAVSPLIFPIAEAGDASLTYLALVALMPSVAALIVLGMLSHQLGWTRLARGLVVGAWAGALGTVGLEIVRAIGFRVFGSMPGSLPMLMGVLVTGRMMAGPNLLSDVAGWAWHFYNGAAFGIIYVLLLGRREWWVGTIYGLVIGILFMVSPVVVSLGIGAFGVQFGPGFAVTVTVAHLAFGSLLGGFVNRWAPLPAAWLLEYAVRLTRDTGAPERPTMSQKA